LPTRAKARDRDDQGDVVGKWAVLDPLDRTIADPAAKRAEVADGVVSDKETRVISSHRALTGLEKTIQRVEVVGEQCALVRAECLEEVFGDRVRAGHESPSIGCASKSDRRIRP
jgi:hypothetical protein